MVLSNLIPRGLVYQTKKRVRNQSNEEANVCGVRDLANNRPFPIWYLLLAKNAPKKETRRDRKWRNVGSRSLYPLEIGWGLEGPREYP